MSREFSGWSRWWENNHIVQSSLKAVIGKNILLGIGELGTEKCCVLFQSLDGGAERKPLWKLSMTYMGYMDFVVFSPFTS